MHWTVQPRISREVLHPWLPESSFVWVFLDNQSYADNHIRSIIVSTISVLIALYYIVLLISRYKVTCRTPMYQIIRAVRKLTHQDKSTILEIPMTIRDLIVKCKYQCFRKKNIRVISRKTQRDIKLGLPNYDE